MKHNLQWFIDRIGKRIYRRAIETCSCKFCSYPADFIIDDGKRKDGTQELRRTFHAQYLFDCSRELGIEYSDKPLEEKK
jgi:hypothetical protein